MGLGEFFQQTATTILLFKADVSDAKRGLKELQGAERKAEEQSIKLQEARNKSYDSAAKAITAATVGMKLFTKGIDLAAGAWKEYEKQALAAGGADAEKAKRFRQSLNEMSKSIDGIEAAVGRLVVSLEPLVRGVAGVAGAVADIMGAIPPELVAVIAGAGVGAFAARRFGSGGRVARALPLVGTGVVLGGEAANWYGDNYQTSLTGGIQDQRTAAANAARQQASADFIAQSDSKIAWQTVGELRRTLALNEKVLRAYGIKVGPQGRGGPAVDNSIQWDSENSLLGRYWGHTTGTYSGTGGALGGAGTDYGTGASAPGYYSGSEFDLTGMQQGFKGASGGMQEYAAGQSRSIMESYLGPIDDINAYQVAFQGLTSSVTAAFDAWVSGSMSAGAAAKAAIAMTLQALGKEMLIRALQETAMGFASLAIGGPIAGVSAGGHFKAAALFGAGAAAAGVASASLQSGGNQGGYGGPPSSYSGGGSRSSGSEGTTTIVYVGEGWTTSPAQQRAQTARAFRSARRELEGVDGVRDA